MTRPGIEPRSPEPLENTPPPQKIGIYFHVFGYIFIVIFFLVSRNVLMYHDIFSRAEINTVSKKKKKKKKYQYTLVHR